LCKSGDSVFHFLYNPLDTRKSIIRDQTEGPLDSNPETQFIFLFAGVEGGKGDGRRYNEHKTIILRADLAIFVCVLGDYIHSSTILLIDFD
jgi:hypothetical protein